MKVIYNKATPCRFKSMLADRWFDGLIVGENVTGVNNGSSMVEYREYIIKCNEPIGEMQINYVLRRRYNRRGKKIDITGKPIGFNSNDVVKSLASEMRWSLDDFLL